MIDQRRRADDIDDLATFLGPLPLVQPSEPEVEQSDELGRVIPRPNPAILKRERREARIKRRQARRQKSGEEEEEGFSTDSSLSKPEASDYANALKSLAARTKDVLADVRAEDFRDPGKGRWSVWREKYADSYIGAWGGLGVVGVWEFWVRLEMVGWDCVEVGLLNFSGSHSDTMARRTRKVLTASNGIKGCTNTQDRLRGMGVKAN